MEGDTASKGENGVEREPGLMAVVSLALEIAGGIPSSTSVLSVEH